MEILTELYCVVDDFCQAFLPEFESHLLAEHTSTYHRPCRLSSAEIMTLLIYFHQSGYRNFKQYYTEHVAVYLKKEFPHLVSYNRFVELMPTVLMPLCFFIHCQHKTDTGIYFIDATPIRVCHIKRASSNRVFKQLARKSKSTMGWYFGFKLHIVVNDKGELMAFSITKATTDDRVPVTQLTQALSGKLIGDKGYLSQKRTKLH